MQTRTLVQAFQPRRDASQHLVGDALQLQLGLFQEVQTPLLVILNPQTVEVLQDVLRAAVPLNLTSSIEENHVGCVDLGLHLEECGEPLVKGCLLPCLCQGDFEMHLGVRVVLPTKETV